MPLHSSVVERTGERVGRPGGRGIAGALVWTLLICPVQAEAGSVSASPLTLRR